MIIREKELKLVPSQTLTMPKGSEVVAANITSSGLTLAVLMDERVVDIEQHVVSVVNTGNPAPRWCNKDNRIHTSKAGAMGMHVFTTKLEDYEFSVSSGHFMSFPADASVISIRKSNDVLIFMVASGGAKDMVEFEVAMVKYGDVFKDWCRDKNYAGSCYDEDRVSFQVFMREVQHERD